MGEKSLKPITTYEGCIASRATKARFIFIFYTGEFMITHLHLGMILPANNNI